MNDKYEFQAYIATLVTLAVIFIAALIVAAMFPQIESKIEVFGLGTVMGGLIGILRSPFSGAAKTSPISASASVEAASPVSASAI